MYKNALPLIDQELIGNALGLTVPEEDAYLFVHPRIGEMPRAGWGTQIYKEEYSPNTAFKNLGIPLTMEMHLIDNFDSIDGVKQYLIDNEMNNSDILVCYDYGVLFNTDSHNGHVNVFDSYDKETHLVLLVDPEQRVSKYRKVPIETLYQAMVTHGKEKSGGFWQLTKH